MEPKDKKQKKTEKEKVEEKGKKKNVEQEEKDERGGWPDIDFRKNLGCG